MDHARADAPGLIPLQLQRRAALRGLPEIVRKLSFGERRDTGYNP